MRQYGDTRVAWVFNRDSYIYVLEEHSILLSLSPVIYFPFLSNACLCMLGRFISNSILDSQWQLDACSLSYPDRIDSTFSAEPSRLENSFQSKQGHANSMVVFLSLGRVHDCLESRSEYGYSVHSPATLGSDPERFKRVKFYKRSYSERNKFSIKNRIGFWKSYHCAGPRLAVNCISCCWNMVLVTSPGSSLTACTPSF